MEPTSCPWEDMDYVASPEVRARPIRAINATSGNEAHREKRWASARKQPPSGQHTCVAAFRRRSQRWRPNLPHLRTGPEIARATAKCALREVRSGGLACLARTLITHWHTPVREGVRACLFLTLCSPETCPRRGPFGRQMRQAMGNEVVPCERGRSCCALQNPRQVETLALFMPSLFPSILCINISSL
jgi:hypothetical protein